MNSSKKDQYLDPNESMGYLSRLCFRAFSRTLESKTIVHGVTSGQWRFLRVLWENDGITQSELSRLVGTKEPTTVRSIQSLEKSKFVVRSQDPSDKRKLRILLTEKSRTLRRKLMPYVIEVNLQATKGISKKDQETAKKVLRQMYHNLT